MKQSRWGIAWVVPLAMMSLDCGGTAFSGVTGDGGIGSSGGSGGGIDSGSGGGSGGSGSSGSSGSTGGSGGSSGGGSGGGSGSSGGSTSGGGSGSSSGGCGAGCTDGGPAPACPAQVLSSKVACSPQGLECEYGSNPVQDCDYVQTCNGTWQVANPTDSKCGSTLGAGCPLTFDAVSQGSTCADNGLVCNYPRGRCACVDSFGGPIILVDGSVPARWACQDPSTAGCPMPRAPLGSACTEEGLSCDYGTCSVPGGTAEECQNGLWQQALVVCPVNAGAAQ
jgi:hypothetical protein